VAEGPVGVIFDVDEQSIVNVVQYTFQKFLKWNDPAVSESTDGTRTAVPRDGAIIQAISEQTIDLLTTADLVIQGTLGDSVAAIGEHTLNYGVPGMMWACPDGLGLLLIPLDIPQYVRDAGDVIVDRRGWGALKGELEVYDTVVGEPGDYLDLELPHQVNAKVSQSPVAQRGGSRKVQVVGRTPKAGTAVLQLEDAGNLAQSPPDTPDEPGTDALPVPEFDLSPSVDAPLTVAVATVTNDADLIGFGADVEWEYATGDTEPAGSGTPFGPLVLGFDVTAIDVPAVAPGSTVWVRARAVIAATGERSAWSAWQSITLGPDDDGTGGTLPPIDLVLTIDTAGVVDASATGVAEIVKVYFAAGTPNGAAPDFAAVLAGVSDSSVPFEAPDIITLTEGQSVAVGAIGEDALGNRTILVIETITFTIDTGSQAGTPGNFTRTLHTTPTAVCREVGAAAAEPEEAIPARFFANTAKWGKARLQLGAHRNATPGATVPLLYSLVADPSPSDWHESGVFVRADRVKFPEPGDFLALVAEAKANNVLLTWGTKGGDGSTVIEVGNIYLEAVLGTTPPDSPEPPDDDLPTDMGTVILDLNALTLLASGRADGSAVDAANQWPDDSGHVPDAKPYPGTMLQTAAVFKTAGFPGGLPSVRVSGGDQGFYVLKPTSGEFTLYFVIGNLDGAGANGDEENANAPIVHTQGAAGSNFWLSVDEDGALQSAVNSSVFGFTGTLGSGGPYSGAGTKHIIRMAWKPSLRDWYVYVDGVLDTFRSDPPVTIGNLMTGVARWFFANFSTSANKLSADYGRVLAYDRAHTASGLNSVELALQAVWGTP